MPLLKSTAHNANARPASLSSPRVIFWTALVVRVLYITLAHTYRFSIFEDHFTFGYEMGRIGRALATGYGYADPFNGHSGPTAWIPPLYPLLIAAVFKIAGVYTALSAWLILTLNSVFSAATAVFVYQIAARCYNSKVALWSAWIWALYPAAMQYATRFIWDMALTTMLFAAVFALALRMRGISPRPEGSGRGDIRKDENTQTTKQWLLFGLLWALIGLSNSTLLLFLPVCGIWILAGAQPKGPAIRRAIASGLIFIAAVSPWMIRNYHTFHAFIPFRSNFGAELHMGNNPESMGMPWGKTLNGEYDVRRYTAIGELAYSKQQGDLAKVWIRRHPSRFAALSAKRFYFFCSTVPHPATRHESLIFVRDINYCVPNILAILGLALSFKRRTPAAALFLWAFILLPLTYYFVTVEARFRHPLEPLIVILAVFLFQSAQPGWGVPSFRRFYKRIGTGIARRRMLD